MKKYICNPDASFFFAANEIPHICEYVRKKYPEEVAEAIKKADETCNNTFVFDCRWDLESCFEPVQFTASTAIDWLYQPADDPEWTYALNRMRYWICLGQAYVLTHDEKYAHTFVSQLLDWTTRVKRTDPTYAPAWRSIEAGFRLEYWIKAWQYFRASPAITSEVEHVFCTSIIDHAEHVIAAYNDFNVISNWGVLANHGLFMAGVLLKGGNRYIQIALERLEQEITTQVYRDGMQWEQSPMYHNEVLHDFLDVLILAERNAIPIKNTIRYKVRDMCYADCFLQKPDHHQILMGDSDDLDISYNIARGAYLFKDLQLKACTISSFDYDTIWDTGFAANVTFEKLTLHPPRPTLFMEESGNMCIRSDWSEQATYIHFHCGTLGAGHGHCDQLHIDVCAGGEDILTDAGRFTYVSKPERYEFKNPQAHNALVVDNSTYCEWTDSWSAQSQCRAINQKCVDVGKYVYCEGGHTGYIFTGVLLNRRLIFIDPDILFVCDEGMSTGTHTYQQYFHFSDTGTLIQDDFACAGSVTANYRFTGQKNQAVLSVISSNSVQSNAATYKTRMSRHYNQSTERDTVCVNSKHSGFISLSACLFLQTAVQEQLVIQKLDVTSAITGRTFTDDQIEAWNITRGSRQYTLVIAHREFAAPTDMFVADGCTGFANVMVFDRTFHTSSVLLR